MHPLNRTIKYSEIFYGGILTEKLLPPLVAELGHTQSVDDVVF